MSKIICDICGTAYPETATQCPICGSVRPGGVEAVPAATENGEEAPRTYTYVKGGRFSKQNVKKRNRERMASGQYEAPEEDYDDYGDEEKSNTGLVIAVIVLALAIVATLLYIGSRFMRPDELPGSDNRPVATTEQTEPSTEETEPTIPCQDVMISKQSITFEKKGVAYLLNVTTQPKDTTDEIKFHSSDETVVTVTDGGKLTAVGSGEALITVSCGDKVTQCEILCIFEGETTEPTETQETVNPNAELKLNREDFTMTSKGSTWKLYNGDIPDEQITWTSDNEKVATVKNGTVTATGRGVATITAEYGGTKVTCVVRCADSVGTYTEPTEPTPEQEEVRNYTINKTDVTIRVGETFTLTLKNKEGEIVNVTWHMSDPNICTVSGNNITGAAKGTILLSTDYDGEYYQCTVRVSE